MRILETDEDREHQRYRLDRRPETFSCGAKARLQAIFELGSILVGATHALATETTSEKEDQFDAPEALLHIIEPTAIWQAQQIREDALEAHHILQPALSRLIDITRPHMVEGRLWGDVESIAKHQAKHHHRWQKDVDATAT